MLYFKNQVQALKAVSDVAGDVRGALLPCDTPAEVAGVFLSFLEDAPNALFVLRNGPPSAGNYIFTEERAAAFRQHLQAAVAEFLLVDGRHWRYGKLFSPRCGSPRFLKNDERESISAALTVAAVAFIRGGG